jgi:hypothetical protein
MDIDWLDILGCVFIKTPPGPIIFPSKAGEVTLDIKLFGTNDEVLVESAGVVGGIATGLDVTEVDDDMDPTKLFWFSFISLFFPLIMFLLISSFLRFLL